MSKVIYCLYDGSGIAGLDAAKAGHSVFCFNADSANHGAYFIKMDHPNLHYINLWIDEDFDEKRKLMSIPDPDFIFAFPDCTHVAVSGAQHDKTTDQKDETVRSAKYVQMLGEKYQCPWVVENPVSQLATKWRKPDSYFDPYEYGGYLSGEEAQFHPKMPKFDAYTKKTSLWYGNGFKVPPKKPVDHIGYCWSWKHLGGKSKKTKVLRSLTPRGWAKAVFEANLSS
ncbi:MAG: DNA cytosine methyltransferase [Actinobacteria bacterium]|nr:DNA cytosine methyltransferase [Actinomycetota bacterium]